MCPVASEAGDRLLSSAGRGRAAGLRSATLGVPGPGPEPAPEAFSVRGARPSEALGPCSSAHLTSLHPLCSSGAGTSCRGTLRVAGHMWEVETSRHQQERGRRGPPALGRAPPPQGPQGQLSLLCWRGGRGRRRNTALWRGGPAHPRPWGQAEDRARRSRGLCRETIRSVLFSARTYKGENGNSQLSPLSLQFKGAKQPRLGVGRCTAQKAPPWHVPCPLWGRWQVSPVQAHVCTSIACLRGVLCTHPVSTRAEGDGTCRAEVAKLLPQSR